MSQGVAVATVTTARRQLGGGNHSAVVRGEIPEEWTSRALLGWNKPGNDSSEEWPRRRGGTV